jgi:hypothetical protein
MNITAGAPGRDGSTDFRVRGAALVGWMSTVNNAVPGHLLTYLWDDGRQCVSAVGSDTREAWVQSEADAVDFLSRS